MAQVPKNEGFSIAPNEGAAYHGQQYIDPGIKFTTPDFSKAAERFDKFQMQQDETRADAVMMELERRRIDNEKSMKSILGEDAMRADEQGRGLVQRYDEDLRKYGTELTKDLTINQQRLFNQKAEKTYLAQYGTAAQHVLQQNHKWQNDTYTAKLQLAAESGRTYYDKHEEIERLRGEIATDVRKLGDINGWSEEVIQAQIKANTSAMMVNVLNTYFENMEINPNLSADALGFLTNNSKYMLGKDVLAARKIINGYQNILFVDNAVKSVKDFLYIDTGSVEAAALSAGKNGKFTLEGAEHFFKGYVAPRVGGQQTINNEVVKDPTQLDRGVDAELVRTGAGRISLKDAKATVERNKSDFLEGFNETAFNTDLVYNTRIAGKHFSHLVETFAGDVDQTMAAFFSSEDNVKGAIEQAKKHGVPGEWITYLPPDVATRVAAFKESLKTATGSKVVDENGKEVSVFSPEYTKKFNRNRIYSSVDDLYARVEANNPILKSNPVLAEQVKQGISKTVTEDKQTYAQKQTNVVNQLWDWVVENGKDIDSASAPQTLISQLDTNQYRALQAETKAYVNGSKSDDPILYATYMGNDDNLRSLTRDELRGLRPAFRKETYDLVEKRWAALQEKENQSAQLRESEKAAAAQLKWVGDYAKVDDSKIKGLLKDRIPAKMWKDLEGDPDAMNMVVANARSFILQNAQAGGLGTAVQTLGELADQYVVNQLPISGDVRLFGSLRYKDLPNRGPADAQGVINMLARGLLESRVGANYSDEMLTDKVRDVALSKLMWSKQLPFGIPPNYMNVLDKGLVNHIIKIHGGKEPPAVDLLREYVLLLFSGYKLDQEYVNYTDISGNRGGDDYYVPGSF